MMKIESVRLYAEMGCIYCSFSIILNETRLMFIQMFSNYTFISYNECIGMKVFYVNILTIYFNWSNATPQQLLIGICSLIPAMVKF